MSMAIAMAILRCRYQYEQCRITNVGGLVQNFSGGLFSRRMGAPVSQTNAAGGSVQYSWGSGGRCKPTSGVRKRTHFGNNVYKICFVCNKKILCGGPLIVGGLERPHHSHHC